MSTNAYLFYHSNGNFTDPALFQSNTMNSIIHFSRGTSSLKVVQRNILRFFKWRGEAEHYIYIILMNIQVLLLWYSSTSLNFELVIVEFEFVVQIFYLQIFSSVCIGFYRSYTYKEAL